MAIDDALLLAAWAVLLVLALALAPRLVRGHAPAEPEPREATFYDVGGPILDLTPELTPQR